MLPPLFPSEVSEPVKQKVEAIESSVRGSVNHTLAALQSSLWLIGGVLALVLGSLGTLVVVVMAMGPVDPTTSAANRNDSGNVQGAWTSYYYANPESSDEPALFNSGHLQWQLENFAEDHSRTEFGIVVVPVHSEGLTELNSDRVFTGASTTKVLTAAAILNKVDQGELAMDSVAYQLLPEKKDEDEEGQKEDVHQQSSPSATPTPEPKNVSIEEALRLMINRSDNVAWEKLIALVGSRNLQTYAEGLGMRDYNVRNNDVTPRDLAVLLQKLYKNELLSEHSTRHLLSLMQHTNEEQMIPAAIQSAGEVYHKYGWLGQNIHDIAIIDNHGNPVVVVIMSKGSANHATGKALVRDVAEIIEQALVSSD